MATETQSVWLRKAAQTEIKREGFFLGFLPGGHCKQFPTEINTFTSRPGGLRMEESVVERDVFSFCIHSFIFATLVNCRVRTQAQGETMKEQRKQQNKHPHKRSLRKTDFYKRLLLDAAVTKCLRGHVIISTTAIW